MAVRASPAVMSILSLYVHYSTTLYLFFQIHSPATLSTLFKYIYIYIFILLSHLNIIFFIHSLLLFTSNNYLYNPNSHNPNPSHPSLPPPPPPPWINPEQPKPTVTTTMNQLSTTTKSISQQPNRVKFQSSKTKELKRKKRKEKKTQIFSLPYISKAWTQSEPLCSKQKWKAELLLHTMSTTTHSKLASASTCGLHPWLHEQVLELVSLGKDLIEVDLDANGYGFPRARANHGAPTLLGPSWDR